MIVQKFPRVFFRTCLKYTGKTNYFGASATLVAAKRQSEPQKELNRDHKLTLRSLSASVVESPPSSLASKFVDAFPPSVQPFLRLSRVDRPIGSWLLYWPCTWGIAMATSPGCLPSLKMLALFGAGAFLMRGAGCVVNDLWDINFDKKVSRTASRPLASSAVSKTGAISWLGFNLVLALPIGLSLNLQSFALALSALGLVAFYPSMKRITNWPQVWLGLTINWGVLVGYSAIKGHLDYSIILPLYAAGICWTVIYDTVYAHQDKEDDDAIGLKSTALYFGGKTKPWLAVFGAAMGVCGTAAGVAGHLTWPYFTSLYASLAVLGWQVWKVDLDKPQECLNVFRNNWWIGLALFLGISMGNFLRE